VQSGGGTEGMCQREGDHDVTDPALGQLEGDRRRLDLDDRAEGDAGTLCSGEQLAPRRVHVTPAHFGQDQIGTGQVSHRDGARGRGAPAEPTSCRRGHAGAFGP